MECNGQYFYIFCLRRISTPKKLISDSWLMLISLPLGNVRRNTHSSCDADSLLCSLIMVSCWNDQPSFSRPCRWRLRLSSMMPAESKVKNKISLITNRRLPVIRAYSDRVADRWAWLRFRTLANRHLHCVCLVVALKLPGVNQHRPGAAFSICGVGYLRKLSTANLIIPHAGRPKTCRLV